MIWRLFTLKDRQIITGIFPNDKEVMTGISPNGREVIARISPNGKSSRLVEIHRPALFKGNSVIFPSIEKSFTF
jgi:hypothetical protein